MAHFYLSSETFDNDSIAHVISSLLFLRDMSITYNEEAYNHIVNNLTILSDEDSPVFANMNHRIYALIPPDFDGNQSCRTLNIGSN